ncbi:MAG: hypothetical protein LDL16_09425 [Thiobacillus sp.]|nr:hypothetical protein [Thiobacillus sp.]
MEMGVPVIQAGLSAAAMALTFVAFVPYFRSVFSGTTRPHVFSWLVWGSNTSVAFVATLSAGGGAGAWAVGFSAAITLAVAALAWTRRADVSITRTDWLFFLAGLAAIPVWFVASDPLWAIALVTAVELLGFGPTMRKSWHQPWSEPVSFLAILAVRNALVIAALEQRSLATMLFPAAMAGACILLIGILVVRRQSLPPPARPARV